MIAPSFGSFGSPRLAGEQIEPTASYPFVSAVQGEGDAMAGIWSTEQVRPQDRLAYWVEVVCRAIVHVDCVPREDRPLSSHVGIDTAGLLRIGWADGTAQTISRPQQNIARNPKDHFALVVHGAGTTSFAYLGRETFLEPGDMVLHDMNQPFEFRFETDWAQTILLIPRGALLSRVGDIGSRLGVKIDGTTGVAGMLSPLLASLPRQLSRIPDHARERLGDNLLDLIATAIVTSSEQPFESSSMTLVRVKLWIERHLGEALSAESIATQCGLSSRHLNRLFAHENTSLMQFVLDRRLARCHRDLNDPAMRGRSITDIALGAGFSDLSHFSRSYRARYGCAATETRLSAICRADRPDA